MSGEKRSNRAAPLAKRMCYWVCVLSLRSGSGLHRSELEGQTMEEAIHVRFCRIQLDRNAQQLAGAEGQPLNSCHHAH